MKLRIDENLWRRFQSALRESRDLETAGVILAEPIDGGEVLIARYLHLVPDSGYAIRRGDQLQITPVALNRLIRPARLGGMSIITAHSHPRTATPWFSQADDLGDERLMPSFYVQSPGPHGSLVIAGDSGMTAARIWRLRTGPEELELRIVGSTLGMLSGLSRQMEGPGDWFSCQELALGDHGQRALRCLHVGVVGLGGTGSVCAAQLAHLGVARLTLVDGDVAEASNISRIIGGERRDAHKTPKAEIAARYVERVGLNTQVRVIPGYLGRDVDVMELSGCDVVLSCVDTHSPRALLNRLAYERLIPVIDMGSVFRVDETGRITSSAGRVVIVGPGRPCLGCWGHIDPRQLHVESLSTAEREAQVAEGYVDGASIAQPSVIPFNTFIAGCAVIELLRLVTGFQGAEEPPQRLNFDFQSGSVRRNRLALPPECRICGMHARPNAQESERAAHSA